MNLRSILLNSPFLMAACLTATEKPTRAMDKKRHTVEQIIRILREADSGLFVTIRSA